MPCNKSRGMATLLQQKNCMKTLPTNGGGANSTVNSNSEVINTTGGSSATGTTIQPQNRMLLPHEMVGISSAIPITNLNTSTFISGPNTVATASGLTLFNTNNYQQQQYHHQQQQQQPQQFIIEQDQQFNKTFSSPIINNHESNIIYLSTATAPAATINNILVNSFSSSSSTTSNNLITSTPLGAGNSSFLFNNNINSNQNNISNSNNNMSAAASIAVVSNSNLPSQNAAVVFHSSTAATGTVTVNSTAMNSKHQHMAFTSLPSQQQQSAGINSTGNLGTLIYNNIKQEQDFKFDMTGATYSSAKQQDQDLRTTNNAINNKTVSANNGQQQQSHSNHIDGGGGSSTLNGIMPPPDAAVAGVEEVEQEIDIVINNVVCSFSVRCHLNLREIALNGFNVEFRRENGMVTMKLRRPYTTASIWSSGRITCTGATSEEQAKIAARRYARCLQKLGFSVRFQNFRVVNVLGTCSMPWSIKIVNFSEKYKKDASYEPELHPGVTYKLRYPKATLKIFSTGSITVTAASVANVQAAIEHIYPLVYEFRKKRTAEDLELLRSKRHLVEDLAPEEDEFMIHSPSAKKRKPLGLAENDPEEDIMGVSDCEQGLDE